MKIFIWASFMVIFFTACTPLASATVYTLPELTKSIEVIEILMDKGSVDFRGGGAVDVSGNIQTNQSDLVPRFLQENGRYLISQPNGSTDLSPQKKSVINDWQLRFGKNPYDLYIQTETIITIRQRVPY